MWFPSTLRLPRHGEYCGFSQSNRFNILKFSGGGEVEKINADLQDLPSSPPPKKKKLCSPHKIVYFSKNVPSAQNLVLNH